MSSNVVNQNSVKSEETVRQDNYACYGCLATDCELYDLREKRLEKDFGELTGLSEWGGVMCCVCLRLLRKFRLFRWRCRNVNFILQQIQPVKQYLNTLFSVLKAKNISLSSIDKKHLKHNLEKTKTECINFNPDDPNPNLSATGILRIDLQREFDVPLLADNLDVKTKAETDNCYSPTLIGEFIAKDEYIKQDVDDDYDTGGYGEHVQDNDFPWPHDDDDDDDKILATIITKKDRKKLKVSTSKKTKRKVKSEHKDSPKLKRIKKEKVVSSLDSNDDDVSDKKNTGKVLPEDQVLTTKIASCIRGMWKNNRNKDIYQIFDRIYEESLLIKNNDDNGSERLSKEELSTRKKIRSFLDLVQKLSVIYNVEINFVRLEDLKNEMDQKRNSGDYKTADHCCVLCCKNYNFAETYERHMVRNHNNDWSVECNICRYKFKKQRDLLSHLMLHARSIKCRECGANVPGKWNLAAKHADYHRGVIHKCTLCELTFTRKKTLAMHLRSKHRAQIGATMCLLCGDTYNGEEGLKIHIRCIHKQAAQCGSCLVWFVDKDVRSVHQASAGGCQPEQSSCPMCGGNFANAALMLEHHKEQHPMYKCAECKITFESNKICVHFKYNHNLVKGKPSKKRVRFYNKEIICEVCGKNNFTCVATLKIHQRIHTGERPHQCEICQKTFRQRSDLKMHTAIHTGERSYKCPYCPRSFRQQPHLKSHLPTHTKERAHVCEICHKRFTQRANMQEHVRTIHEGLPPKRRQRHAKIFEA